MELLPLPSNNIAEITLIGTGGGYGESIVVHLGNSNWIIVDSCVDPITKKILPLEYLRSIGVDIEKDVKLILCTHWHDDHIKGLSTILDLCKNAIFSMARPNDLGKFLLFVELDYRKLTVQPSNVSMEECSKCFEILKARKSIKKNAAKDKALFIVQIAKTLNSEVISISPSDFTMNEYDKEISSLITEYGSSAKKIISQTPNDKSVALFLKLGPHRAILGADLEVVENDNRVGWLNILDDKGLIDKKSTLFKIPHHGSLNGYHERIWIELLEASPISKLTPWNKNGKLPNVEMLKKYTDHTNELFLTSPVYDTRVKKRDKQIDKFIKKLDLNIKEVRYSLGIVQCRIDITDKNSNWKVELEGEAFKIS